MAKRKAASSVESSQRSKGKSVEEETTSRLGKIFKVSPKVRNLLKDEAAIKLFEKNMSSREIEMGRNVDFEWLARENTIELGVLLHIVGWHKFVSVNEVVYPNLVRILYANLDPYSMTSWIGNKEVKLDVDTWCETFEIPNLSGDAEAPIRDMPKEELFTKLFHKEGLSHKLWVNVAELPQDPTTRLAATVLMNIIIPKKGSKEQIKEEEARVLYTLLKGADLNIAREVVERVKQSKFRKSTPLCYPMHLMVIMKRAGINPTVAGDVDLKRLKPTSYIDEKTLRRLGFRKDITRWNYEGRGHGRPKFTGESHQEAGEAEEEEERRDEGTTAGQEESAIPQPSSLPRPSPKGKGKGPSTPTHPPPQPQLQTQLTNLTNQIAHFSSYLTEKLDFFTATVNSRMDSIDSKLDDLGLRVKNCETHLSRFQPSPTPRPPSPQASQSQPQPQPQPRQASPQPSDSPFFSMEELLRSATPTPPPFTTPHPEPIPILSPTLSPKHSIPEPSTTPQPTPSTQPLSESELATHVVKKTLKIQTPRRFKTLASKPKPKDFSKSFQKKKK